MSIIKGLQGENCGVSAFTAVINLPADTDSGTFPDPPIPVVLGTWRITTITPTITPFLNLVQNMLRINVRHGSFCGFLDPELGEDDLTLKMPGFIFPCRNESDVCGSSILGAGSPYAGYLVAYHSSDTPPDCCTGEPGYVEVDLEAAAVDCPETDCTMHALLFDAVKLNGDPFDFSVLLTCELIAPPP